MTIILILSGYRLKFYLLILGYNHHITNVCCSNAVKSVKCICSKSIDCFRRVFQSVRFEPNKSVKSCTASTALF